MTEFDASITGVLEEVAKTWPGVRVDPGDFVAYVRARLATDVEPAEALRRLHPVDLYLACACAAGQPAALSAFKDAYLPGLETALRAMGAPEGTVDDVVERLLAELLVAQPDAPAKIRQYEGRSPLRAWLHVVATRMALRTLRRERKRATADQLAGKIEEPVNDPEIGYMKLLYRDAFATAFQEAARALSSRERNLLRFHFVDGLTGEEIARVYTVHRATGVRWLSQARETLLVSTRERLITKLAVKRGETESIMRLVQSQLDFSIRSLFATRDD